MNDGDCLRAWLTLANAPGVGPRTVSKLIGHFGGPCEILAAAPGALEVAGVRVPGIKAIRSPDESAIDSALAWAEQESAHILACDDPRYPPLLRELADAPILLYVRGDPSVLSDPQLALVGSRNPTPAGHETTLQFARHLAACGLTITSGLAIGVDGVAHAGALENGRTIAVLGTGPDRVYPAAHRNLAQRVAEGGALVTELPPGTNAVGRNFPRRNRIISGMSLGTLVTEAALKSGSLITARYASEQGREVFAIPGSIHNPLARGCHALIRDGAKLVETAQDIFEELAPLLGPLLAADGPRTGNDARKGSDGVLDADYQRLLGSLGQDPLAPDELIQRSGLSAEAVASMLLLLELEGYVSSYPGGRYCRTLGGPDNP